ncbi:hypothetical protein KQI84_17460 [bacterium]|nr:hypothetical protein [bacterium]
MTRQVQQTFYVVLPHQPPDVGGSVRPISRLVKEEEEQIRQRLLIPTFQIFRRYANRSNAEGFRNQLHALGVETFIVSDTELKGHLFLWAKRADQGAGGLAIRDFSDQPLYCPFEDLRAITIGTVQREDGSKVQVIDLQRKSTPITPRIDTSLFDFGAMMNRQDAGVEQFLEVIETAADIKVDRDFDAIADHMPQVREALASHPGEFPPAADAIEVAYDRPYMKSYNLYSFLYRARLIKMDELQAGDDPTGKHRQP